MITQSEINLLDLAVNGLASEDELKRARGVVGKLTGMLEREEWAQRDGMTHGTQAPETKVSEKARLLVGNVLSNTYALLSYIGELERDAKRLDVLRGLSTAVLFSNSGGGVTAVLGSASTEKIPHLTVYGDTLNDALDAAAEESR